MLYCPLFQSNKNKYFENYQIIKILSKPKLNFQIDNTDAEGRLILADALWYAQTLDPRIVVDLATLTGAIGVALGPATCGVFTNSNK